MNDWRDILGSLTDLPEGEESAPSTDNVTSETKTSARLDVITERKGRAGKVATIVTGFTCGDDEVATVAAALKKRLGTGGSARGGEILIQGNRAADVTAALTDMGYKARKI